MFKAISLTTGQAGEFWWGLKHTCSGQHEAPEPKEVLGHNTFKCLWKKIMTQSHDCSGEEETSGPWLRTCPEQPFLGPPPLQCKKHVCGKQQGFFVLFWCFLLSYWKKPKQSWWLSLDADLYPMRFPSPGLTCTVTWENAEMSITECHLCKIFPTVRRFIPCPGF